MKEKYVALYNKNAEFLHAHPKLKKAVSLYNRYVSLLFVAAYLFLWVYGVFWAEFSPKDFAKIFFVPSLALLLASVMRFAFDRPRPFAEDGARITPLEEKGSTNSFPSRHISSAAVVAMTFLPYLPLCAAILFVLTAGLGYSRFALGWHYPSDLFAGLILGILCGLGMFLL